MKTQKINPEALLDEAIAAVASEVPAEKVEREAASRVWEHLSRQATETTGEASPHAVPDEGQPITSCEDYQALMPAYVAGQLPAARALLVADHTRECVPCRRALKEARRVAEGRTAPAAATVRTSSGWQRWARLAAVLLLVAGAAFGGFYVLDVFDMNPEIARVQAVEGQLFQVAAATTLPLSPGATLAEGEVVRTGKDAGAVLRLEDGSEIEMRERSEIAIAERRGATTIRVTRGSIIVEAARQHDHLYVATEDCLVSVTGTIFAVNHGIKGSRVSVVEGEVRVEQGRSESLLHPGDQVVTHAGLGRSTVEDEVAWSRNYDHYVALLHEFNALNRQWNETLAATGLRYDSRLLSLVPAGTTIYVALPNVTEELAEMERIFTERMGENPELARWWQERVGNSGADSRIREILSRLSGLGQHLGEEIVVAVSLGEDGQRGNPVLLAEVANPSAFAAVLSAEVERLNTEAGEERLVIVQDPATAPSTDDVILLWHAGDLFVAAPDAEQLRAVAAVLANPAANPFVSSSFYARLAEAYSQGAQWLVGADVGRLLAGEAGRGDAEALAFSGFDAAQHLVIERKSNGETVHTGAALSFAGPRQGVASWLAAPAPMGSLDFVSAEATFVASFVVEEPASILEQTLRFVGANDPEAIAELSRFEQEHGIRLIDDLAAPLGGEMTFALDGPVLPKPAWKVVAEVYDPVRLQQSIEWAVEEARRGIAEHGGEHAEGVEITLTEETVGGKTFYRLAVTGKPVEIHYTFDGGYFIATPTRALLERALSVRDSGYGITDAPVFTGLLPQDGFVNFSALAFTNLGSVGEALLSAAETAGMTEEQRRALEQLDLAAPNLTVAYGEADRVRLVSTGRGGLLGSRLGGLLGLSALAPRWDS